MNRMRMIWVSVLALTIGLASAMPARALDEAHRQKGEAAVTKAIEYLRKAQAEDGSWSSRPGPAITGLVASGMSRSPDLTPDDPTMTKALGYIMGMQKEDGGIYDKALRNYNTSICLMALGRIGGDDPKMRQAIDKAQKFLVSLQWDEDKPGPDGRKITRAHPYFGGAGYGDSSHGRPDGSNTFMMLAALYDSGYDCTSPEFQNAIVYVARLQGAATNDLFADQIVNDGGLIYATSIDKENVGKPQTRTDEEYEKIKTGEKEEYAGPRPTYGSMTYAGYMSFLYAQLDRADARVVAARAWIANNYTTETHPNMGEKSYYYYMHFLARALAANGEKMIATRDGKAHDWANEVIDALVQRQREDGAWANAAESNWMEGDPNLATAYSLIALQTALGR